MTTQQSRPAGIRAAQVSLAADPSLDDLPPELAHLYGLNMRATEVRAIGRRVFRQLAASGELEQLIANVWRRVVLEALQEALPGHWLARAEELERAEAWDAAVACRRHAWLLSQGLPVDVADEVDAALGVV